VIDKDVTIWDEYGYLGHTASISFYGTFVDETSSLTKTLPRKHKVLVILSGILKIRKLIDTIKIYHR